jgi:hypothetical protein
MMQEHSRLFSCYLVLTSSRQVQKLVRYLKIGNQTATIIALCNLVSVFINYFSFLIIEKQNKLLSSPQACPKHNFESLAKRQVKIP